MMKEREEEKSNTDPEVVHHHGSVPDRGWSAWLQCVGSFCLLLNSFGIINSYGAFQTYYRQELLPEYSNSQIAWIGSIQAFLNIFLGVVAGPIYDSGRLRLLLIVGSLATFLGLVLTALCTQYWQLILAQGILVGSGAGLLFLPSIAILSQYFDDHLSTATGIGSSGSAIGSICIPIMFNRLQPSIGFRNAVWCIALLSLVTLLVALLILRMRFKPAKVRALVDMQAFRESPFVAWSAYLFISLLGLYIPSVYIQQYAATITETNLSFWTLPALNAGSFFGRLVAHAPNPICFPFWLTKLQMPLYLADKIGPLNLEIPFTLIASIVAFAWIAVDSIGGVFVLAVVYGFFAGAITTLTAPIDIAMSPNLDVVGVRMGMLLVPWSLGLLLSTPIGGAILGSSSDWTGLQIFTGVVLIAAAICCLAVRVTKYGWKLCQC